MSPTPDKQALVAAFRALLAERLAALEAGGDAARDGTRVDGSHRPANRGERAAVTSQGYLAHGLAERAAAIREDLRLLDEVDLSLADAVRAGALVDLEDDDGRHRGYLVLPGGAGDRLNEVTVISPSAPLARALRGRVEGDVVTIRQGKRQVDAEVVRVR